MLNYRNGLLPITILILLMKTAALTYEIVNNTMCVCVCVCVCVWREYKRTHKNYVGSVLKRQSLKGSFLVNLVSNSYERNLGESESTKNQDAICLALFGKH